MKVPAGLPLAACCWLALMVTSTLARPQKLQLTPREFRAFKTVLGHNRALSITSAVPVMAFSDKNPSKYVQLPLDHIGGQTGHPSPAELLDTTSEDFGATFGRGAGNSGHTFGGAEQGKYQGLVNFNAGDLQRGSDFDSSVGDGGAFGPNKIVPLTYGFKPIYGPVGHSQSIGSNKASGGLVHTSFSPSTQVGKEAFGSIGSIGGDDDFSLELSEIGRKPHLASDENLFRHHVGSSLVPTSGGGPGSKAVGKLLKSQGNGLDESDVVARSVDGRSILNDLLKEANGNKVIDVSGGALQSSAAVGASIRVRGSSKGQLKSFKEETSSLNLPKLTSAGFVSDSGAIVVRGGDSKARETLPDPSASIFDSSRIEASSIFPSNSVRIPQLPNVQLPLQTQEARSFEGQELPLHASQSTFTGNQQQVKLIIESSNSQKRQVPQIPNSVKPAAKNTATANTESLLRLLRSQTPSESEPSTSPGKFTREISPQARQIPGAIPSKASTQARGPVSSNGAPPGFRPIPATPRQNARRSANPSLEQQRSSGTIRFDNVASQQNQRPQVAPTPPAPSTRSVEQPRTNNQFGRAVSHQSQQQFHPHFSPGPFSANSQTNSAQQLQKLQQRQQQQQQEQKHREQQQEKRQEQLKGQQGLQQLADRQQKQEQRQQQQSQQQREQQQRQQQQQREQQQQQQHQLQQQQRQQPKQQQQPQSQQNPQQQQRHQQQKQNPQQSVRLGTKVTSGQPQTLDEFLSGNSKPVSQLQQQRPRPAQATIPGKISQQSGLQQPQTIKTTKSNSQIPRIQQSKVAQTSTSGSHQLGTTSGSTQVRLQQSQTGTSNSASSQQSQQLRFVQKPTPNVVQVVSNQQVQPKPQQQFVKTSTIQQAKTPAAQTLPSTTSPGGTTVFSATSGSNVGSLPASALQALGALGGGGAGGAQPHIVVKTLSLDAKDADPNSEAFKKALAEATKQARLELGVRDSEELGVASGDLANLFGKKRRKRQLFGGGEASNAQTVGNALSTGAGLFGSTLGIFLDTVWQAYQNFLRGTETVGLLAIDQIEDLTAARAEESTTPDPFAFRRR